MKILRFAAILLLAALVLSLPLLAQEKLTPAQQKIAWAKKAIENNPDQSRHYNDLALALARRARETSDVSYYAQAEAALEKSFQLAPDNLEGQKVRVWVLLGKHEFARALELARVLNKRTPDDVLIYGFLADANVELGNYKDAEEAAQWMLDIRPGNVPGLARAAYLRELFGDVDGAVDLMNAAYQQTPPSELEDRAWILTQVAHLELLDGKLGAAEKLLQQALQFFPGYHYALGNLAKVRIEQQKYAEAVELLRQRLNAAPHAENRYALAEALELAGRDEEARAAYAAFEEKARQEIDWADNANRELIFYYADHERSRSFGATEALRIARIEVARRHDAHTLDAYAWALYVNGQYAEARKQIEAALAVGIRDARIFYHAGAIALKAGDPKAASGYLKMSLELDPRSECSAAARAALEKLAPAAAAVTR
jgi:tetratricopeptide (TPR) repeat protein